MELTKVVIVTLFGLISLCLLLAPSTAMSKVDSSFPAVPPGIEPALHRAKRQIWQPYAGASRFRYGHFQHMGHVGSDGTSGHQGSMFGRDKRTG